MSQYAALAVVSTALDAAIDRTRWHAVCERMSEGFALQGAALAAGDTINVPEGIGLSDAIMRHWPKLHALMEQGAVEDDLIYQHAIAQSEANTLLSEWDMVGASREAPLGHSRIRDFLIREVGMAERYGLKLNTYGPQCDTLILYTKPETPRIDGEQATLLKLTTPILGQSIRVMYLFQRLRDRFNASLGALDQLGIGALRVDGRNQIIHANGTARGILQEADGLYRDASGRLAARDDMVNRALSAACQNAFATAVGEDIKEQSVLTAKRRSKGSDFLITVSAVSDPLAELQPDLRSALVFIVDPNDRDRLSSSGIKALGLLTPAEMAVADLLVHGASTLEISEQREVSEDTVRRQIKSIFAKLNCRSRADVIRLAVATRLPMKEGEPLRPGPAGPA